MTTDANAEPPQGLTLGTLYRRLRDGRGDRGWARASIRFEESTAESRAIGGGTPLPGRMRRTSFGAELDFWNARLRRADMTASQPPPLNPLRVRFGTSADGVFGYSTDGITFGAYSGAVELFDLGGFENMLDFVGVNDVRIEATAGGGTLDEFTTLSVIIDREAFSRLLRAFGNDVDTHDGPLTLVNHSLQLSDTGALSLDYGWQMSGTTEREGDEVRVAVSCRVTIGLMALGDSEPPSVVISDAKAPLEKVDDVWIAARREQPA